MLQPDAAERFVGALPDGRLVTVPDVGHNVHGGNTPGFLAAVGPFLAALDALRHLSNSLCVSDHARHALIAHAELQRWLSAASVTGSPAIRVCHMRRGSVMSNGVPGASGGGCPR